MQKKEDYFSKELLFCLRVSDAGFDEEDYIREIINNNFDWDYFLNESLKHRLFVPVARKLLSYKNLLPDEQKERLSKRITRMSKRILQINTESTKIQKIFNENGIKNYTLKGARLTETLYGNPLERFTHDIDLIISKDNISKARNILEDIGYGLSQPYNNYNEDYLKLLFIRSNQLKYINRKEKVVLELHWKLFSSHFLNNHLNEDFRSYSKYADFSGITIYNTFFLMIHGAIHFWNRLFWLRDIRYITQKNLVDLKEIHDLSKELNLEKIFLLNLSMLDYFYDTDYSEKFDTAKNDVYKLRNSCLFLLNNPNDEYKFNRSMKQLYHKFKIGNGLNYKVHFFKSLLFRIEDVKRYDKYRFFLYLLLPITKLNNFINIQNARRKN